MAVQVFKSSAGSIDPYKTGEKVQMQDGHLFVLDSQEKAIAIYPPGSWHHVDIIK